MSASCSTTVQAIADETTGQIAAVFVDTVSRVLPGAEENLQKDMTRFVEACDAVRNKFGATVIGIHHTNYAGGIRGSTRDPRRWRLPDRNPARAGGDVRLDLCQEDQGCARTAGSSS